VNATIFIANSHLSKTGLQTAEIANNERNSENSEHRRKAAPLASDHLHTIDASLTVRV
jgi:hypothetical protein